MANRYFTQFFYSFFKKPTMIAGSAIFTAAGSTWALVNFPGVDSITTNSAGDFTINLSDKYNGLISFSAVIESTTSQDRIWQVDSNAVTSAALGVRALAAATPTTLTDQSVVYFKIILSNSSV